MKLRRLPDSIGESEQLDRPAGWLAGQVGRRVKTGPLKDLLSGTWLGHPLHPMLTDLPIGFWTSAMVLDLVGGADTDRAADALVGLGVLSTVPAVASGLSDFADTEGSERRLGVVHALANASALLLYIASLAARRRGSRRAGVALGMAGGAAATLGGYLGGHLVSALGIGVDNTAFEHGPSDWTAVISEIDLIEGKPVAVPAGEASVLLVRQHGEIRAIADRCTHRGGPLHEGRLDGGCVTCPWHGSVFRLADGEIVRGPATLPQPAYDTRVVGDQVEVRRR